MAARDAGDHVAAAGPVVDLRVVAAAEPVDRGPGEPVSLRLADSSVTVESHLVEAADERR